MVASSVVHVVEELHYSGLSRAVKLCNEVTLRSRKNFEVYLRNVVHAAHKDTYETVVDTDVLLTILHHHFRSSGYEPELVVVQYIVDGIQIDRPIGLLLSLLSGEEVLVAWCENKRCCEEKRLLSHLRDLVTSSLAEVGFILDVDAKAVLHVYGSTSLNGGLHPAITAKGTPCADCGWYIKMYGRRCWRKSHRDQEDGGDVVQGSNSEASLKPALTRKNLPCCDCVTAIAKKNRRCWRKAHQVQEQYVK
jgi:hypothetical protein